MALLLLLSTRDCAKSLVSQAGTVSRVHVSSWSGDWRIDGSAGPEPEGREEGRRIREKGRGERRRERRKDSVLKASMQGAGWLSLHVRGSLSSCGEEHCLQRKGRGRWWWRRGLGVVFRGNRAFPTWSDIPKQKGLFVNSLWLSLWTYSDLLS